MVLHEIDAALRSLLRAGLPDDTTVRFDAPDGAWHGPGLDVFLYGVREDLTARMSTWAEARDPQGRLLGRQPPMRRYHVHYLLTGWSKTAEDEHRLLGEAMAVFATHEVIPPDHLDGSLRAAELPVAVSLGHPELGSATPDVWSALGIPPRVALDVVVTATLVPALVTNLAEGARSVELGMGQTVPEPVKPPSAKPNRWPSQAIRERS
jgi:hypothetical protein